MFAATVILYVLVGNTGDNTSILQCFEREVLWCSGRKSCLLLFNDVTLVFVVSANKLGLMEWQLTAVRMCAHQPRQFVNNQLRIDELMPGIMRQTHLCFLLDTMEQSP